MSNWCKVHCISWVSQGVKVNPAKIEAIMKMPLLNSINELHCFLDMITLWKVHTKSARCYQKAKITTYSHSMSEKLSS